jgi:threonine dehydratase
LDLSARVRDAGARIAGHVRETPVQRAPGLGSGGSAEVFFKLENFQLTGSFKLRGAMNFALSLSAAERECGLVTASTGNHGLAVAHAAAVVGAGAIVFVPEGSAGGKLERLRACGIEVAVAGADCVETELHARAWAEQHGSVYVPPYNDERIVAGQGTIGAELARQLPELDRVYVSLGGGGLVSGIAGYLKSVRPEIEVTACSPRNSPVMAESIRAGRILELPATPTLSDGTAGGVEPGSITFELVRRYVDRHVIVDEDAIRSATRDVIARHSMLIEGAAGLAVAGCLQERERWAGKRVVVVLCGANIGPATLREVLGE